LIDEKVMEEESRLKDLNKFKIEKKVLEERLKTLYIRIKELRMEID
jgi:hypothetical protein